VLVSAPTTYVIAESPPESDREVGEVVVRGDRERDARRDASGNFATSTSKDLRDRAQGGLGEALTNLPGISSSSFGPGASRPVIRGQGGERVRVIENGTSVGDVSTISDDHAVPVDILNADKVEVFRGPKSLLYGTTSIGGVVNVIDQSIAETTSGGPLSGRVVGGLGSNEDREQTGAVQLRGDTPFLTWFLSTSQRDSADLGIPGSSESARLRESEGEAHSDEGDEEGKRRLAGSSVFSRSWKAGVSHVFDSGFLGMAIRGYDTVYGIPGHAEEAEHEEEEGSHSSVPGHDELATNEEPKVSLDLEQIRVEMRGEKRFQEGTVKSVRFNGSVSSYRHKELEGEEVGTRFKSRTYDLRLEAHHGLSSRVDGDIGFQLNGTNFEAVGDEAYIPPNKSYVPAFFISEEFKYTDAILFRGAGRIDLTYFDTESFQDRDSLSRSFTPVNASTGFSWRLSSDVVFEGTVSYNERAPTSSELFALGAHAATRSFDIGDINLDKERSVGVEAGLKDEDGALTWSTSVFAQQFRDYINLSPSGEIREGLPVFTYNHTRARFIGGEGRVGYSVFGKDSHHRLDIGGGLDYVYAQDTRSDEPLPRIPPLKTLISSTYGYKRFSVTVEGIFSSSQSRVASSELKTDEYRVLNVSGKYSIPLAQHFVGDLFVRGTNLTNEEVRMHTSFLKDLAPARGRAILTGIELSF
jgi:iron complex outermembrane recepter protein